LYKKLGVCLMIVSGLFYTSERIAVIAADSRVAAALTAQQQGYQPPSHPIMFSNFFVWFLSLTGFVLLTYGFPKKP
jgi:hypothetical protein